MHVNMRDLNAHYPLDSW